MTIPMHTTISILNTSTTTAVLGARLANAGFPVMFGCSDPDDGRLTAHPRQHGAWAGSFREAANFGKIVVVDADPGQVPAIIAATGNLRGRVVLDLSKSPDTTGRAPSRRDTVSVAEKFAALAPRAKVVKSTNFLLPELLATPTFWDEDQDFHLCGDHAVAKALVIQMLHKLGLNVLDAGPLSNARLLESQNQLWHHLVRASQAESNAILEASLR